ncbi:DUF4897 domain-containing protein [Halobacteriales archaeon QS_8_69_26]|nr:MAG: DUF4897 domain-containing protein [Halobacteriales archaeon QS_8_69_26]
MRGGTTRTVVVCLGVALLVGATLAGGTVTGAEELVDGADDDAEQSGTADAQAPPPTDNTVTRIRVRPNGDAVWTVQVRTRLTEDRVDEYEAFQRRVRENSSRFLGDFERRMSRVVDNTAAETGRSMAAEEFRISTSIQEVPRRWGVVTYEFTWRNLARTEGERLVVGDVFQGGFFLAENDTLVVEAPDGYRVEGADPGPDGRENDADAVAWDGERNFAHTRPQVVIEPAPTTAGGDTTTDGDDPGSDGTTGDPGTTTADGDGDPGDAGETPLALFGGAIVVVLSAVGAYAYVSGAAVPTIPVGGRGEDGDEDEDDGSGEEDDDGDEGPAAGDGPAGIVTDDDRVIALLEERGGRVKQAHIADELDWSSSKTSRTLSDMAEEGTVEKIRIGRENVIRFPEDEDDGGDRSWGDT